MPLTLLRRPPSNLSGQIASRRHGTRGNHGYAGAGDGMREERMTARHTCRGADGRGTRWREPAGVARVSVSSAYSAPLRFGFRHVRFDFCDSSTTRLYW